MNPKRILIIEDDEFLRQIYGDTLSGETGFQVTVVQDGEEGLKRVMEGGWDLVLLDMILPKVTGIEILKKVRATPPKTPVGKIIVASNLDEGKDFQEASGMADGYIVKSNLNPGELLEKVKEYLKG